ncbi:MAG: hypothetical protein AAFX06_31915 [Planctomycetota bacterium]
MSHVSSHALLPNQPSWRASTGRTRVSPPAAKKRAGIGLRFVQFFWLASLVLIPLYIAPEGKPQPADLMLAGTSALVFILYLCSVASFRLEPSLRLTAFSLSAFIGYVVLNNIAWAAVLVRLDFVFAAAFYLFNFSVALGFLLLYQRCGKGILHLTTFAVVIAVIWQLLYCRFFAGGVRPSGTFNNPNQLGYFAVLCGSVLACSIDLFRSKILRVMLWGVLGLSGWIALISLSRGGVYAFALLGLALLYRYRVQGVVLLPALLCVAVSVVDVGELMQSRLAETKDEEGHTRGYERIWMFPQYLPVGAGEGGYKRVWTPGVGKHEIHSSWGTLAFSYGLPGIVLFAFFAWRFIKVGGMDTVLFLLPTSAYSLTHNGLRFRMFWILLMFVYCASEYRRQQRARLISAAR